MKFIKDLYKKYKIKKLKKEIEEFNTLLEEIIKVYPFLKLEYLKTISHLRSEVINYCLNDKDIFFIIEYDKNEDAFFVGDYYYHTHPPGAWLKLFEIKDDKIKINDSYNVLKDSVEEEYRALTNIKKIIINSYKHIIDNVLSDKIKLKQIEDEFELYLINNKF